MYTRDSIDKIWGVQYRHITFKYMNITFQTSYSIVCERSEGCKVPPRCHSKNATIFEKFRSSYKGTVLLI